METAWEKTENGKTSYVHIDPFNLVVGEHYGSGHTDNAGSCSHQEFLGGRFQKEIEATFGAGVLEEIIAAVTSAAEISSISDARAAIEHSNRFIMEIPEDPGLADIRRHKDTLNGYFNYGNEGGYKTVLASDTLKLTVERNSGFIEDGSGGRIEFSLPGHCSALVERKDHFFLTHTDHFAEIGPDGRILFDTSRETNMADIFGNDLRIKNCFRHGDTIFVAYWWFSDVHPDGLLKYESGRGFTGRLLLT